MEEWENEAVGKRDGTYMFKLLGKYGNMRYIYPEEEANEYFTICTHKMKWIQPDNEKNKKKPDNGKRKRKKKNGKDKSDDNYRGWACILIPKGEEYIDDELEEYAVHYITANEDLHTCIAICDQDNVKVVDNDRKVIDPVLEFEDQFGHKGYTHPGKWKNIPNRN